MACCLAPLCMFGSPADFWFVAVGALVSTVAGCIIVLVKVIINNTKRQIINYRCDKVENWNGKGFNIDESVALAPNLSLFLFSHTFAM